MTALLLLSVLSAQPVDRFLEANPASATLRSPDGRRLVHASGFSLDTGAPRPEDAARAFLATHGASFGVTARQALVLAGTPAAGRPGAVRFERTIDGLPVFGGDLVVGVDAQNRVLLVNAGDVGPSISGRHAIGDAAAEAAAFASFPPTARRSGPVSIARGWRTFGSVVRAVFRIDFIASEPAGDWRVFVDGETGEALFRENLRYRASAPGSVFEVSPVETGNAICPSSGSSPSFCASPVEVTLPNLVTASDLAGTQTTVYDCNGSNGPATAADVPGACASVVPVNGVFDFPVDPTYRSSTDDFAAVMAYYHLDRHVSFFKALDPTLPGGAGRAVRASLPALVNAFSGGAPLDNAYFSGGLDAMVFGQGPTADYAYDATVAYHELTHGVVFAWGGFNADIDALGGLAEPRAVNEGTADAMAVSETGRSEIGSFLAATSNPPEAYVRDLSDPGATRTCKGNGTVVSQLGTTAINGLDGEVHDDGQIWNGFFWEVYQGLKTAGIRACSGSCEAGPALQYAALQLAAGTSPTLASYWQTMKSAATALFPSQPAAAAYVDCVARRRGLDACDRTVPVYAGETKLQFIDQRFSPFQVTLQVTGPTLLGICSAQGTSTTLYARNGFPVQIDPTTGAATADRSSTFAQPCSSPATSVSLPSAGTWYLLLDSPNALMGNSPGFDAYLLHPSSTNVATRPPRLSPPTCVPPILAIAPTPPLPAGQQPQVPPRGSMAFAASGGSGEGYAWSLAANPSGGSISAAGVYTAGPTGSGVSGVVIDVVHVSDSLGNTATRDVQVTQGVTISPASASAAPNATLHFTAYGGSGVGFTWSLATNASGGSIDGTTGSYTAGPNVNVSDVVHVVDSLGNAADATVAVAVPPARPSTGGGCGTGGGSDLSAMALAFAALLRRLGRPKGRRSRVRG